MTVSQIGVQSVREDRESNRLQTTSGTKSDSSITLAVARTATDFVKLQKEWALLEQEVCGAPIFQSAAWASAVFSFEAARTNSLFDPVIVTLRKNGQLVGLLPLERVKTRFRTVLMPLGNTFPQYSDALVRPDVELRSVLSAMIRAARQAAPSDVILFLKVRADGALNAGLPKRRVLLNSDQGAPFLDMIGWADFPSFYSTIKSKTRKNIRNARNRLEREAPLVHEVAITPADQVGVIDRTLNGRAGRLRDQGLTSRAFASDGFLEFCKALPWQNDIELLAMSLRHGDKPIAEQWGFIYRNRYFAYVATRDFTSSDESPGKLQLGEIVKVCFEKNLKAADFLVPVMPYKVTWSNNIMNVSDYAIPCTIKGWVLTVVWDQLLRPSAKRLFIRTPPKLRAALMKCFRLMTG